MPYAIIKVETNQFFSKKNIITFMVLAVMILAIPVGVSILQQQTQLKSKATGTAGVTVSIDDKDKCPGESNCTTNSQINLTITSPFGPSSP